jgi:hypothetical protein
MNKRPRLCSIQTRQDGDSHQPPTTEAAKMTNSATLATLISALSFAGSSAGTKPEAAAEAKGELFAVPEQPVEAAAQPQIATVAKPARFARLLSDEVRLCWAA